LGEDARVLLNGVTCIVSAGMKNGDKFLNVKNESK